MPMSGSLAIDLTSRSRTIGTLNEIAMDESHVNLWLTVEPSGSHVTHKKLRPLTHHVSDGLPAGNETQVKRSSRESGVERDVRA